MIIGNGDIASVLPDREDRIYFASGVSNSQETRESEFQRELELLWEQNQAELDFRKLIYFSSLSIYYNDTPYTRHKKLLEETVRVWFPNYTIIRLGNITWGQNPNTLINYLKAHPDAPIQDIYRYLVTKEQFLDCINNLPDFNCEINLIGRKLKVEEIVEEIKLGKL